MSLYPILWAVEHAPVRDAEERAILTALVSKGDFDGRNCHRSYKTLAKVARVDAKTAGRKCREMERRGILRRQAGPMPESWKRLPADKKTVVWEVMIPATFWSAVQLEEINGARDERGLPPITPRNRPALPDAPPKRTRADKGRPRLVERGDSKSPRSEEGGGTDSPVAGGLTIPRRGDSKSPNPLLVSSASPSSYSPDVSRVTPAPSAQARVSGEEEGRTAGTSDMPTPGQLVALAAERWHADHRRPTAREHAALAARVADALATGATTDGVIHALTHDLAPGQVRTTAVQVVMSRTKFTGWARLSLAPDTRPAAPALPPRCDDPRHDASVPGDRCLYGNDGTADDFGAGTPCPRCHPRYVAAAG